MRIRIHFYLDGKLDEFRVTKNGAIYTAPFAPASSALDYPVCGNGVSEIGETCDDGNAMTSPVPTTPAVRSVMRAVKVSQALVPLR